MVLEQRDVRVFAHALEHCVDPAQRARLTLAVAAAANEASHYDVAVEHARVAIDLWTERGNLVQAGFAALFSYNLIFPLWTAAFA